MTSADELAAVRAAITDLERALDDLRRRVDRLSGEPPAAAPAASPAARQWSGTGLQAYPHTEDEHVLHRDSDDEGIGGWRPHPLATRPK